MPSKRHYLFIAKLRPEALSEDVKQRNPKRDPERPIVKVGYIKDELPSRKFAGGDFSDRRGVLRRHGKRLLPLFGGANPTSEGSNKREGALASQKRWVEQLRSRGYTVYNRPPARTRKLYVIELDRAILDNKSPNSTYTKEEARESGLAPVYVGETGKAREERLEQHKTGEMTPVHPHAVKLRLDLTDPVRNLTPLTALRKERHLAAKLGSDGHPVYGGK